MSAENTENANTDMPEGSVELDAAKAPKKVSGWLNFAIDFGPLLIFFLTYRYYAPDSDAGSQTVQTIRAITYSTGAFMVAILIAVAVSQWKIRRVSPMLWLSALLILGFGALTIYLGDETFIQIKPTIIYSFFAAILLIGVMRGKSMLKYLLHAAFDGLNEEGWLKLSRNWGFFFVFLALLNEAMRHFFSFETWLTLKVWGVTAISFVFTFTQLPMLMKHGFAVEDESAEEN